VAGDRGGLRQRRGSRRTARVDGVAQHLARHRVAIGSATAAAAAGSIADQLILSARIENADLIVTGGCGHRRLGEWIFGGVTGDFLTSSPVCCLFSN
jgi:nucleotide-binding universal stress UspA family protein